MLVGKLWAKIRNEKANRKLAATHQTDGLNNSLPRSFRACVKIWCQENLGFVFKMKSKHFFENT